MAAVYVNSLYWTVAYQCCGSEIRGVGCFFDPLDHRIQNKFFRIPDPKSRILDLTHISKSLVSIYWVKNSLSLTKTFLFICIYLKKNNLWNLCHRLVGLDKLNILASEYVRTVHLNRWLFSLPKYFTTLKFCSVHWNKVFRNYVKWKSKPSLQTGR